MKIFYLITKSDTGGAQTHIYQLTQYMRQQGHAVAVMSYPGGWLEQEVRAAGADFYANHFFSNRPNPLRFIRAIHQIRRAVCDFNPDIVSCHSSAAGFLGRIAVHNSVPTIFTAHGIGFTEGVPWARKYLMIGVEKIVSWYCEKIICVSEHDKNLLLQYRIKNPKDIIVIHNGVETGEGSLSKQNSRYIKVIFVGRLTDQKDPLLLLEAYASLPEAIRNRVEVLVIGDGPKRRSLEQWVKTHALAHNIRLLGGLSRERVFFFLKQADIFVLPTHWEGFPRSILEAMSFGVPVIATDVGGVKEAVGEECGILVKRNDGQGIKEALTRLISSDTLRRQMGEMARTRVRQYFSLKEMFQKTELVYEEISEGR